MVEAPYVLLLIGLVASVVVGLVVSDRVRREPPRRGGRWQRNQSLMLVLSGGAVTATVGGILVVLLPLCRSDGQAMSCLAENGIEVMWFAMPPVLASMLSLLVPQWRVMRVVASGVLWFYALYEPLFYGLSASLLTVSIFLPYRPAVVRQGT